MNKKVTLFGTKWCDPCKKIKKWLDDNGLEYNYVLIDNEESIAMANKFNVKSVPVLLYEDAPDIRLTGLKPLDEILAFVKEQSNT